MGDALIVSEAQRVHAEVIFGSGESVDHPFRAAMCFEKTRRAQSEMKRESIHIHACIMMKSVG